MSRIYLHNFNRRLGRTALLLFIGMMSSGCVKLTMCPEWQVRTIDKQGKPVADVAITQVWGYNGLNIDREETIKSGPDGLAVLPKRTVVTHPLYFLQTVGFFISRFTLHGGSAGPGRYAYLKLRKKAFNRYTINIDEYEIKIEFDDEESIKENGVFKTTAIVALDWKGWYVTKMQPGHAGYMQSKPWIRYLIRKLRGRGTWMVLSTGLDEWQGKGARQLGEVGPKAKAALPALTRALKNESGYLRIQAAYAMHKIDPANKKSVPVLIEATNDKNPYLRVRAAQALSKIEPAGKFALSVLISELKNQDRDLRIYAAFALGELGPKAIAAIPALTELLKDKSPFVRKAVQWALQKIKSVE